MPPWGATGRAWGISTAVGTRLAATGRDFCRVEGGGHRVGLPGCGPVGPRAAQSGHNRRMAEEPECHKVEWTRLEIGDRSWRVKLEYG